MNEEKVIKIVESLEIFLSEKKSQNMSIETLKTYRVHLNYFIEISNLRDSFTDYISYCHVSIWNEFVNNMQVDKKKNDVTIASYCRSIRVYLY